MKRKVLIAAGGTGGHLFPAQQLAELLKKDSEILFAGHKLSLSPFFEKEHIPFEEIASARIRNPISFLLSSLKGLFQSVRLLRKFKPDVVVGFGSYHSFPVLLASVLLGKKLVLFEANCILGKVNRLFLPWARKIAVQFPLVKPSKKQAAVPLLPWSGKKTEVLPPADARKKFGLDPDLFTILVFGGSQGAVFLNREFGPAALLLKEKGKSFQVIHLTGKEGSGAAEFYRKAGIPACVKEFEKEMGAAYSAADLAVCRSGAGTMAELIRFQKPALLIPYPYAAEGHQEINARYMADALQGARVLIQAAASRENLAAELEALWDERKSRQEALKQVELNPTIDFGALVRNTGMNHE